MKEVLLTDENPKHRDPWAVKRIAQGHKEAESCSDQSQSPDHDRHTVLHTEGFWQWWKKLFFFLNLEHVKILKTYENVSGIMEGVPTQLPSNLEG